MKILLLPAEGKSGQPVELSNGSSQYEFTDYKEVPVGVCVIETSTPARQTSTLPLYLSKESQATVLIRIQDGKTSTEIIDDSSAAHGNTREFNVYNLLLGTKGDMGIKLGAAFDSHQISPGGSVRVHGVKAALYPVSIDGTDNEGKSFHWSGETDLRSSHRSTLLICPDSYGRIRPRLLDDEPPVNAGPGKGGG